MKKVKPEHLSLEEYKDLTNKYVPLEGFIKVAYPLPLDKNPISGIIYNNKSQEEDKKIIRANGMFVVEIGKGTETDLVEGDIIYADQHTNIVFSEEFFITKQIEVNGKSIDVDFKYGCVIFNKNFVSVKVRK